MPEPAPGRSRAVALTVAAVLALILAGACAGDGGDADGPPLDDPTTPTTRPTSPDATDAPDPTGAESLGPLPIVGGTDESGQPEPPPVHAIASLVVAGPTPWWPYLADDLRDLDDAASTALVDRLRRATRPFDQASVPLTVELALGPLTALCDTEPDLLDELEAAGHHLGGHATRLADVLRIGDEFDRCGRHLTTLSGFGRLVAPSGRAPDRTTAVDAAEILAVQDVLQLTGPLSPTCTELGLAQPTHAYGTGAFTAPWRSGWVEGNPCVDRTAGRLVAIDQTPLAPLGAASGGSDRLDAAAVAAVANRVDQALAYCADLRFREPAELPAPGLVTWGVTVHLDDLIPASGRSTDAEGSDPLSLLGELLESLAEPVEQTRLVWTSPERIGATLRVS